MATKAEHTNASRFNILKPSKQQSGKLTGWTLTALLSLLLLEMDAKIGAARLKLTVDTGASLLIHPLSNVNGIMIEPLPVSLTTTNGNKIKYYSQANMEIGIPSFREF